MQRYNFPSYVWLNWIAALKLRYKQPIRNSVESNLVIELYYYWHLWQGTTYKWIQMKSEMQGKRERKKKREIKMNSRGERDKSS